MARPRKSISTTAGGRMEIKLVAIPIATLEDQKKLNEAHELVAYFVGLGISARKKKQRKEEIGHAA